MKPLTYTTFIRRGAMNVNSNLIMRVIMALMMIVVGLPMLAQEESDPDKIHVITEKDCDFELVEDGDIKYIFIHSTRVKGNVYIPSSMFVHVGESYKEYPVYVVQEDVPVATKITFAPGIKEVLICTGFWLESVKFEGKDTKVAFNFCIPDNFPVKVKEVIFPENLTEFGGFKYYKDFNEKRGTNIFENCNTLTNVRLPKKLRKIGPNMFKKCTGLTSIDIPESVKVIGYSAFEKCTNLVFPDGLPFLSQLDTLGNAAFAWCGFNMENVTIPKNLKNLHLNSFQACYITNLTVEEGVEEVGLGNAFIKNITLPKSVHTLYGEMTSNTETFIVHPDAPITELPRKAFYNHKTLKKVQLPKALQTIGLEAFRMCENLADINLEETSLKTIDCMAFDYCNALQHVVLPNTVETIEDGAFMECSSLKSFTFTNDVANIGKDILKDCESLNTVVFPEKFTSITDYMFSAMYLEPYN